MKNNFEDQWVEGVFLIVASSKNVFLNRMHKIKSLTPFASHGYEEDEEGGVWKVITTGYFENKKELKDLISTLNNFNWKWLLLSDSTLLIDGNEIYSDGKWIK